MSSEEITIRSLQHFMYCPHRWGLMEIDRAWAENAYVTKSNLTHQRVHKENQQYSLRGKRTFTSVPVYNDQEPYNLYGITDCIELAEDEEGVSVDETEKKYHLCIVEYKPSKPKNADYHEPDLIQVFAQKLCVDYVFGGDCEGVLYYADVKKRISLPLRENYDRYDALLRTMLQEMRHDLQIGQIPSIRKGQNCSGCSMKNLCMPDLRLPKDFASELQKIMKAP